MIGKEEFLIPIIWDVKTNENFIEEISFSIEDENKIEKILKKISYSSSDIENIEIKIKQKFFTNGKKFKTTENTILAKTLGMQDKIKNGLKIIYSKSFIRGYVSQYQNSIQDLSLRYIKYVLSGEEEGFGKDFKYYDIFIKNIISAKHKFSFNKDVYEQFKALGPDSIYGYDIKDDDKQIIIIKFIFNLLNRPNFFTGKEELEKEKIINEIIYPLNWEIGLS